jgi:DNA-binding MarR family transcriptional regulator
LNTENSDKSSFSEPMYKLNELSDALYRFVMLYRDYMNDTHDYGSGDMLSMVEMHTLTAIDDNPGITINQMAKMWHRTNGAISQTATKLEAKSYIIRKKMDGNAKNIHLFTTPKGKALSEKHKMYDSAEVAETVKELMYVHSCTAEEVDAFFKVIKVYIDLLEEDE